MYKKYINANKIYTYTVEILDEFHYIKVVAIGCANSIFDAFVNKKKKNI